MPFQLELKSKPSAKTNAKSLSAVAPTSGYRLFLIDASVFLHILEYRVAQQHLSQADADLYVRACFHWVNDLGFIPPFRGRKKSVVIWLKDSKPYWRSQVYPPYKAQRRKKDPSLGMGLIREIFEEQSQDYVTIEFPGFEADDLASLYARIWANRAANTAFSEIHFCTGDSDWQGLIARDDQYWVNLNGYGARVRQKPQIHQWLGGAIKKLSEKRQKWWVRPPLKDFRAHDIWTWKSIVGDTADNLKAGPDADLTQPELLSLINLYNPPQEFDLFQQSGAVDMAKQKIQDAVRHSPEFTWDSAESVLNSLGVAPPISYVKESDYAVCGLRR